MFDLFLPCYSPLEGLYDERDDELIIVSEDCHIYRPPPAKDCSVAGGRGAVVVLLDGARLQCDRDFVTKEKTSVLSRVSCVQDVLHHF